MTKVGDKAALLIIDMINPLEFPGADSMLQAIDRTADAIVSLRDQARHAAVPVIYVNDNYGDWHSDRDRLVAHCAHDTNRGSRITKKLAPGNDDLFIIKPQFSGFYATNLPVLLPRLGVTRLILTGLAADICVLFTAADAHMREYELWVPADAVCSSSDEHRRWALEIMEKSMGAVTTKTGDLKLEKWLGETARSIGA